MHGRAHRAVRRRLKRIPKVDHERARQRRRRYPRPVAPQHLQPRLRTHLVQERQPPARVLVRAHALPGGGRGVARRRVLQQFEAVLRRQECRFAVGVVCCAEEGVEGVLRDVEGFLDQVYEVVR